MFNIGCDTWGRVQVAALTVSILMWTSAHIVLKISD